MIALLALAACGGGDDAPAADASPSEAPASGQASTPAADAAPAPSKSGDLTMADAERVGFARTEPKAFAMIGAVDGAGGTMGGGKVELYQYAGEVPAAKLNELRQMAVPAFGWNGLCHVRNLVMFYANEAACQALRGLD
ncbi:MAG TPA: hypothetical protein VFR37_24735 [Longimicrobium sp.]|nr:hypothetical protein [Longimicrobium sp.]